MSNEPKPMYQGGSAEDTKTQKRKLCLSTKERKRMRTNSEAIKAMDESIAKNEADIIKFENALDQTEEKLDDKINEYQDQTNEQIDELDTAINSIRDTLNEHDTILNSITAKIEKDTDNLDDLQRAYEALEADVKQLKKEWAKMDKTII